MGHQISDGIPSSSSVPGTPKRSTSISTAGNSGRRLFIQGLVPGINVRGLERKFSNFGEVSEAHIIRRYKGIRELQNLIEEGVELKTFAIVYGNRIFCGFGLVTMARVEDAQAALENLNGTTWRRQIIVVDHAHQAERICQLDRKTSPVEPQTDNEPLG